MSLSIRFAALGAAMGLFAMPALAQSNFQCVGGELLGGPQGFSCETDRNGRIINVQPRAYTETAPRQQAAPQRQSQGTTVYRGTSRSYVPHQPTTRTYIVPQTRVTTRTYNKPRPTTSSSYRTQTYTHRPAPVTRTYSYAHQPAPVTRSYTYTHQPAPQTYRYTHQPAPTYRSYSGAPTAFRPIIFRCDDEIARLRDTRDGRRQYEVCFADLRPLDYRAAEILYDRVKSAARKACRAHITGSLISRDRSCRREAIKQAVFDVDSPTLDAVYSDKTGRQIPRVRVGRLIYR